MRPSPCRHHAAAAVGAPLPHLIRGSRTVCSTTSSTSQQTADAAAAGIPAHAADCSDVVTRVLSLVEGSDGGINMTQQQRQEVDGLLMQLEAAGTQQTPRPLDNPLLWGNYCVAYASTASAQQERGQPAGGRFRGRVGRALFQTTGVFQSVLQPDLATNKVSFKLLGLLPGAVGLRGKVLPVAAGQPHGQGITGQQDTVRVLFEPPVLSLGEGLHFRIGPPSSVQLATTFLDERVRLGKGSRGSLFVFTRGGAADAAGMADVGLQRSTPAGLAWLGAAFASMAAGGWALWTTGAAMFQLLAGLMWLITVGLAVVVWQGGVNRDEEEVRQTQALQLEMMERSRKAGGPPARGAATGPAVAAAGAT